MSDTLSSNKLIAKNTMLLYIRMLLILVVSLYTSRIILAVLGIEDYGLYNVVGGIVTMFTFISMAMGNSTNRFITFALGKGDKEKLKGIVCSAFVIHLLLAIIILVLAETVGLWFLHHKLVIPEGRTAAAEWVYQFSIVACMISIVSVPYNAIVIAHERMGVFAFISIVDALLKLFVVFMIQISEYDKLIIYAALVLLVNLLDLLIYHYYCKRNFEETQKIKLTTKLSNFKEMTFFAGWSLFGNLSFVGYTQGLNILLNMFFGPSVNAARGIVVSVQNAVKGFVSNFQTALNPQLIKSYAIGDRKRLDFLLFASSKLSFFLLWCIVLPILTESDHILSLWLVEVPKHTSNFLQLLLIIMMWDTLDNPLSTIISATGNIRNFQAIVSFILLLIIPMSYGVLRLCPYPELVFVVHFFFAILAHCSRLLLVKKQVGISVLSYVKNIYVPVFSVSVISYFMSITIPKIASSSIAALLCNCLFSLFYALIVALLIGLTKEERLLFVGKVKSLFNFKSTC